MKGPKAEAAWDDGAVPPVAFCVNCGLCTCAGCDAGALGERGLHLPWEESRRNWVVRLWQTALASSLDPQRTFGELPVGPVGPALGFALVAETLALGSLALLGGAFLSLWAPDLVEQIVGSPVALTALAALLAGSVLLMLCLHTLWGICLDIGGGRVTGPVSWEQGLRFGLYACGWDLLTSPIGVLCSLLTRGPIRGWAPVGAAAHAPRLAQRAYLEVCRGFGVDARRRAIRLCVVVLSIAISLLIVGVVSALVMVAQRLGY